MKKQFVTKRLSYVLFASLLFAACEKSDTAIDTETSGGDISDAASAAATIAVASSASVANADSVYVVQACARGSKRDSVAQADLPAAVSDYLDAAYAGYAFHKAYSIKDSTGTVGGYAVIIYYNDKPVGLEFDAAGAFVKVLEQRDQANGRRARHGGHFQHRDGKGRDSVALSALPASVTAYFGANYSGDTLVKAYKTVDSSLVVLSKNGSLFATVFDADGQFIKRVSLPSRGTRNTAQTIEAAALPAVITAYLTQTYPAYTFQKAFALKEAGNAAGYVIVIDANNTKYAVAFDATGVFIGAKTLY